MTLERVHVGQERASPRQGVVESIMKEAGLSHLSDGFAGMSVDKFRDLMIQEYESFGVFDVEDKQALFKVVKDVDRYVGLSLSREGVREATTVEAERGDAYGDGDGDPLVDTVDGDDDDDDGALLGDGLDLDLGLDLNKNNLDLDEEPSFLDVEDDGDLNLGVEDLMAEDEEMRSASVAGAVAAVQVSKAAAASAALAAAAASVPVSQTSIPSIPPMQSVRATDAGDMPRIRVIVRKRPLNAKEEERGDINVIHCDMEASSLTVYEPKTKVDTTKYIEKHDFKFDDVFDENVDNDDLYIQAVRPLISTAFNSGRGTCFAYGQTGSGKTYTMEPLPLRAAADIFQVADTVEEFRDVTLNVSCYEIYGGKVFDLLGGRARLEVREDAKRKVQVVGLKEVQIKSIDDLSKLCQHAACARSTGSTGANDESSRSHSVMTFAIKRPRDGGHATSRMADEARINKQVGVASSKADKAIIVGKLSFIDLAGSERGADTYDNDKQTRLEGAEINKSLLALKECIRALDMDAGHVPFRGSKLTSVLRDSFIGKNARTVMIANVSPCSSSCEHTLNTLRYADRVKEMKKDESKKKSSSRRESMVDFPGIGSVGGVAEAAAMLRSDAIAAKLMQSVAEREKEREREREKNVERASDRTADPPARIHAHRSGLARAGITTTATTATTTATTTSKTRTNNKETSSSNKDVVEMHRQHIEDVMGLLRREMDLLAKSSDPAAPTGITLDEYARELKSILKQRLKAITSLQSALESI